jgi:cell division transport system permease protein
MRLSYILQETFRSINRNRSSFILAATVQAICLVLLSVFIILTWNLARLSEAARRHIELYAFVDDGTDPTVLVERVSSLDGVAQARFVPKDQALTELRSDLGPDSSLVDALEQKIMLIPGVTEVWSGKDMVARLERITRTVTFLDIGILIIVSLAVLFIAFQTVESSIASRHHEIQIMELVGATGTTVRLPFVFEGTAQGILGGAAAFILAMLCYRLATVVIPATGLPIGIVLLADLGLGALSGVAGSLIALNRIHRVPQAVTTESDEE